jgi:uncharacterized protein (DUF2235 family)
MAKNIILFSDGTGNKGGYGADSNVFKLFNAVDIHCPTTEQITFYDDGVGTNTNKFIRAINGAFGLGFRQNVRDLYEFLARNYEKEDQVYLFGFSRGAATIRAFAGMIQECGLLDRDDDACKTNDRFDEAKFQGLIDEAVQAYANHKSDTDGVGACQERAVGHEEKNKGDIGKGDKSKKASLPIKMIGIWDTVSALGFPQDWSWTVNWVFWSLDKITEWIPGLAHNFYNYQLGPDVEHVYHALAIDDERKTFHPKVWTETRDVDQRPKNIEQVWFAGAHSNVGGGYERAGMSLVALDWMMKRARARGIKFKKFVEDEIAAAADVHDKLYDSRDGVALYYRYAPRDIEQLCEGRLQDPIKIHDSVIERLDRETLRYAPTFLPRQFDVVGSILKDDGTPQKPPVRVDVENVKPEIDAQRSKIRRWVTLGKILYRLFVEATLVLIVFAMWLWNFPELPDFPGDPPSGWRVAGEHLVDFLRYILPEFLEPFVTFAVLVCPSLGAGIVVALVGFYVIREWMYKHEQAGCEYARELVLDAYRVAAAESNGGKK